MQPGRSHLHPSSDESGDIGDMRNIRDLTPPTSRGGAQSGLSAQMIRLPHTPTQSLYRRRSARHNGTSTPPRTTSATSQTATIQESPHSKSQHQRYQNHFTRATSPDVVLVRSTAAEPHSRPASHHHAFMINDSPDISATFPRRLNFVDVTHQPTSVGGEGQQPLHSLNPFLEFLEDEDHANDTVPIRVKTTLTLRADPPQTSDRPHASSSSSGTQSAVAVVAGHQASPCAGASSSHHLSSLVQRAFDDTDMIPNTNSPHHADSAHHHASSSLHHDRPPINPTQINAHSSDFDDDDIEILPSTTSSTFSLHTPASQKNSSLFMKLGKMPSSATTPSTHTPQHPPKRARALHKSPSVKRSRTRGYSAAMARPTDESSPVSLAESVLSAPLVHVGGNINVGDITVFETIEQQQSHHQLKLAETLKHEAEGRKREHWPSCQSPVSASGIVDITSDLASQNHGDNLSTDTPDCVLMGVTYVEPKREELVPRVEAYPPPQEYLDALHADMEPQSMAVNHPLEPTLFTRPSTNDIVYIPNTQHSASENVVVLSNDLDHWDTELEVVSIIDREDDPNIYYPHARKDCKRLRNDPNSTPASYCPNCYCFICDSKVEHCADWFEHASKQCYANARRDFRLAMQKLIRDGEITPDTLRTSEVNKRILDVMHIMQKTQQSAKTSTARGQRTASNKSRSKSSLTNGDARERQTNLLEWLHPTR